MKLFSAAQTDIGRVRRENEDRLLCDDALRAYGVADGVGGLPGGAEAAESAMKHLRAEIALTPPEVAEEMIPIFLAVNDAVAELGGEISPSGIATTLTVGIFTPDDRLLLGHVGDSRCYRLRRGRFEQLTEDHSVENEAKHRRARGEKFDFSERYRHALTRCIGQPEELEVDANEHALQGGDVYLFATDGVTRMLDDAELAEVLRKPLSLMDRLAQIVDRANRAGGADNITAVLVSVEDS